MKESLDLQYVESENPLNDMLQFNLKSEFIEEGSLANFNEAWSSMNGVKAVVYQIEFYEDVSTTLRSFSIVMFFIMIFFLIIAIILIHNTFYFRLNLDRVKIKTMELVGADWKFIKRPYIKESIKVAFYSWLISLALLLIIYVMFLISFPGSSDFFSMGLSIIVLIILGLVSYLICRQSASTLINRYLKQHMHNIY
jgi:cell division transport system permease protein